MSRGARLSLLLGAAPWTWFLVRDVDGRLDALAIAWPVVGGLLVVALLAGSVVSRRRSLALAAGSWLAATVVVVVGPWIPSDGPAPVDGLRIVAANVLRDTDIAGVVRDMEEEAPAVLVVSEVGYRLDLVLQERFRYAVRSPGAAEARGDVAVYSDIPLVEGPLPPSLPRRHGVRVLVRSVDQPFVLYALHLPKPTLRADDEETEVGFREHRRIAEAIGRAAGEEGLPVVVAGDLNLVDRARGYRSLTEELDDAVRTDWVGPTSLRASTRPLFARIDHIFVSSQWCAAGGTIFGLGRSDHRGVAATVGRCPRVS